MIEGIEYEDSNLDNWKSEDLLIKSESRTRKRRYELTSDPMLNASDSRILRPRLDSTVASEQLSSSNIPIIESGSARTRPIRSNKPNSSRQRRNITNESSSNFATIPNVDSPNHHNIDVINASTSHPPFLNQTNSSTTNNSSSFVQPDVPNPQFLTPNTTHQQSHVNTQSFLQYVLNNSIDTNYLAGYPTSFDQNLLNSNNNFNYLSANTSSPPSSSTASSQSLSESDQYALYNFIMRMTSPSIFHQTNTSNTSTSTTNSNSFQNELINFIVSRNEALQSYWHNSVNQPENTRVNNAEARLNHHSVSYNNIFNRHTSQRTQNTYNNQSNGLPMTNPHHLNNMCPYHPFNTDIQLQQQQSSQYHNINRSMPPAYFYNANDFYYPLWPALQSIYPSFDTFFHIAAHLEQRKRGISREELDKLTTYRYKTIKTLSSDETPKCIVCFDDFEPKQNIRVLTCKHEFHAKCIDKWLKINRTCPTCRCDAFDGSAQKLPV